MAASETLHRYELLERIAAGGMAEVFRAKAQGAHGFEKVVAIKRILPELAASEEFVKRFIDEAKMAVELSHANIVQVLDFGRFGGSLYIAMEHVDGLDLSSLLRQAERKNVPVPIGVGLYIAIEVTRALDYAHRKVDAAGRIRGIVHRDVSPSNVLLSYEGEVKLADFGIATATKEASGDRRIMGKWRYMSPEQTEAKPLTRASDLFSAGTVFFELWTGTRLFGGEAVSDIVAAVRGKAIPKASSLRAEVPDSLDRVLAKMLERDPADRYPTAKEVLEDLLEISYERTIRATSIDLADFMRYIAPRESPGPETGRPLDAILRSELGLDTSGALRQTAPTQAGHATFVRRKVDASGLSVWELEPEGQTSHRRERRVSGPLSLTLLVGALLVGALFLSLRGRVEPALPDAGRVASASDRPQGPPVTGRLDVTSRPPGAEVVIDGAQRLVATPGAVTGLSLGRHRVALRRSGFATWEGEVVVSESTVLARDLEPASARLEIDATPPDAVISIDGRRLGSPPQVLTIPIGEHAIVAQRKGYADARQHVRLAEKGAKVHLRLEEDRRFATVDLFSEPWAEIYIDGRDIGKQTPQRGLVIQSGRRRIKLVNPVLGQVKEIAVELAPDERRLIRESLVNAK